MDLDGNLAIPDSLCSTSGLGGGVWGRSPTSDCCQVPSVSDEDLQAQAWFPGTLTVMLHLAEQAATTTLNDSSMRLQQMCCQVSCACLFGADYSASSYVLGQ